MTSGAVSATASKSMPSVSSKSTGVSASSSSSRSSTQGRTPSSSSSPHVALLMPTGTTPRARGTSWFIHAMEATRSGFSSMTVSPKTCSMVTGNAASVLAVASAPVSVEVSSAPQAARTRAEAATAAVVSRREGRMDGFSCE